MEHLENGYASYGGIAYENTPIAEVDIIIQGIPYDGATSGKKGTAKAINALRSISVDMQTMTRKSISIENLILKDVGDIPVYPMSAEKTREYVEKYTINLLDKSNAPIISIGGDHSLSYPLIKSLSKKGKVAIIWFDAHRDLLPELMGTEYSHASPLLRAIELENISPENVLLVGTRYMTTEEEQIMQKYEIKELRMVDLEENNFDLQYFRDKVVEISKDADYIYLSIDIDVLDPAYAPGTGTPVAGGMSTSQLMQYIDAIPVKIRAADIMEVSPPYDHADITIKATMSILTELISKLCNK